MKLAIGQWIAMILVGIILIVPMQGQSSPSNEYWINVASSPLRIVVTNPPVPGRINEMIENISYGSVIEFQLGCIKIDGTNLEVVEQRNVEKIDIGPVSSGGNKLFLPRGLHGTYLMMCSRPNKVAIISVKFADGGKWVVR